MEYQVQENCLTIFLPREVDHHSAEELRKNADAAQAINYIIYTSYDAEGRECIDRGGSRVIMGRYRVVRLIGGEVWAVHTKERIRKILTMSGVTKIMQIYEEEKS